MKKGEEREGKGEGKKEKKEGKIGGREDSSLLLKVFKD